MARRRFLAFEDDSELESLDTDKQIGKKKEGSEDDKPAADSNTDQDAADDSSSEEATPAEGDTPAEGEGEDLSGGEDEGGGDGEEKPKNDLSDPDKPLEVFKPEDLKVVELAELNEAEESKEKNTELVEAVSQDGHAVLKDLDEALEHFQEALKSRSRASLQLAAECFQEAQLGAGLSVPVAIEVPAEGAEVSEELLKPAMESITGTISNIIKAVLEALKKALAWLRQFFRQIWRQIRDLEAANKKATDELIRYRRLNRQHLEAFAKAQGVDYYQYVQLGKHKAFLTINGMLPGENPTPTVPDFAFAFTELNMLMSQGTNYEKLLALLPASCEKFLEYVAQSPDGNLDKQQVIDLFASVPSLENFLPKDATYAVHAHGVSANRDKGHETVLVVSKEYLGNFFQIGHWPDRDFFAQDPDTLDVLGAARIEYKYDSTSQVKNDFARALELVELDKAQKASAAQAQQLISLQRIGDTVEDRLERLTQVLRKAEAINWQNSQNSAQVAAAKNQQVVRLVKAISSVQGSTQAYFRDCAMHVRNVQLAWFYYLKANLKRDMEIYHKGDPRDPQHPIDSGNKSAPKL